MLHTSDLFYVDKFYPLQICRQGGYSLLLKKLTRYSDKTQSLIELLTLMGSCQF